MPSHNLRNPSTNILEFQRLLKGSNRVLALCGAGLSAASGLPTFRGAGGLWRNHDPTDLATPDAFEEDPALVWLFYSWRRHLALKANPNAGHYALAELARQNKNFMCLTQNVDGLSPRAGHSPDMIRMLHGNLFDVKCFDEKCKYIEPNNLRDPLCPALAPASEDYPVDQTLPLLDPKKPTPKIKTEDLPHCPSCKRSGKKSLLRPGVVWFNEPLDDAMLDEVDAWVDKEPIDVMLVIGTAAAVYPAAGYTEKARKRGARIAVINPDPKAKAGLTNNDFFFDADAAEILPKLFELVIGKLEIPEQAK
ncbi:NAD-dependent protein deacylase [Apiospora arundinis]|uniref:DHS-like NAD/FAD-binding domain-containing protein n=1 Tax=Apiospora arundinis TaxID=335852 RepID=A0ABR2I3X6_9PEZI